ncbi:MAG: DMT family transporter [Burkholderiaceae bacterium]|nr:DMT family transporter [Burkholderiaceae bacterium]
MRLSPRAAGLLAAVVTVAVWTGFVISARASARYTLTPFDIAFLRFVGAGLVLLPWGAWLLRRHGLRGSLGVSPLPLGLTVGVGLTAGLLYSLAAYSAFFLAPAAHGAVLMPGSLPLWTTLLAAFFLGDRITPLRAAGLALIVAGDLMVGGPSLWLAFSGEGGRVWIGDLLFMGAALNWGCYTVLVRRHRLDAVHATIGVVAFMAATYVPVYALLAFTGAVASGLAVAPWPEIVTQMVLQGVLSVVVSGISFTLMVQYWGPVRSTMVTASVPVLSALGAVALLGEPLYWNLLAGLALATAGIVLGVLSARAAPAPVPAAAQEAVR